MVYIDMKMPQSCEECRFFDGEDLCHADGKYAISDEQIKRKPGWCPLKSMGNKKKHVCCYWDNGCTLGKKKCPDNYSCEDFD